MTALNLTRRMAFLSAGAAALTACTNAQKINLDPASSAPGEWRTGPSLPLAVQEIYPVLHGGRIHLAGGFVSENGTITGPTDIHHALDLTMGEWVKRGALPKARHHPHLVSFKGGLFALGGFESTPDAIWQMQSGMWLYDDFEDIWYDMPPLPEPCGEAVKAVIGDGLHFAGGRRPKGLNNAAWSDHIDTGTHWRWDGEDWQDAAPLPTARNSASAATIGENWHVVGGRTVSDGNTPAHEVYDSKEDRWRTAAPMPQGQGGLAAASLGGKLYAFGGEFFDNGGGVYPESWAYDPAKDAWTAIPDMPNPRHGLGAVTIDDSIYVIGGALKVGGSETSNLVEIFTP
ncbi:MAG: kelch repeat-containing protein [Pseudomonadota bacterium]